MKSVLLFIILSTGILVISCGDDKVPVAEPCDTTDITYDNTAAAIINRSCATPDCHTNAALKGGYSMEDYEKSKNTVGFGKVVGAINNSNGFSPMPPNGKLSGCEINQLTAWIDQGLN